MSKYLLLLAVLTGLATAGEHRFVYINYDHVLDYQVETGVLRAFDFRRNLPVNDTCDIFVNPPLIEGTKFNDVLSSEIKPENLRISWLGYEFFLLQDTEHSSYIIRRCSGFMPQQTEVPCEVYAAGRGPGFTSEYRYFYGGPQRVIRHNSELNTFDILHYDSDVHGGGYPFSIVLSGKLNVFSGLVDFVHVNIPEPETNLVLVQEHATGNFKVWRYNPGGRTLQELVGDVVMTGKLSSSYRIKTLDSGYLMAYDETDGTFEIWKMYVNGDKIEISVIKRDNIDDGHGCIFHDRQTCIAHPSCGWCTDSTSCHQISRDGHVACDGTKCLSGWVDAQSPDYKKFQQYELPLPGHVLEYGEPGNLTSPLRELSFDSAVPIGRNSDFEDETIDWGLKINPSEGIVYIPPKSADVPCMDDKYQDPANLPTPDVLGQAAKMNDAAGVQPDETHTSPVGEAQKEAGCERAQNVKGATPLVNGTKVAHKDLAHTSPDGESETIDRAPEPKIPESDEPKFVPSDDGTAMEEDLMNKIHSHYASLMPKGDNIVPNRPEIHDPPAPPSSLETDILEFKPKETARVFVESAAPSALIPQAKLYDSSQMEAGVPTTNGVASADCADGVETSKTQTWAMENAQYISKSMYTPPRANPAMVTKANQDDQTGTQNPHEQQIKVSEPEQGIVEGWAVQDVHTDAAQKFLEPAEPLQHDTGVSVPPPAERTLDAVREYEHEIESEVAAEEKKERQVSEELKELEHDAQTATTGEAMDHFNNPPDVPQIPEE